MQVTPRRSVIAIAIALLFTALIASATPGAEFDEPWETVVVANGQNAWSGWTFDGSDVDTGTSTYADVLARAAQTYDQNCAIGVSGCSLEVDATETWTDGLTSILSHPMALYGNHSLNLTFYYRADESGLGDSEIWTTLSSYAPTVQCGGMGLLMTAGDITDSRTLQFYTSDGFNPPSEGTVVGVLPAYDTWYKVNVRYNVSLATAQARVFSTGGSLLLESAPLTMPCEGEEFAFFANKVEFTTRETGSGSHRWLYDEVHLETDGVVVAEGLIESMEPADSDSDGVYNGVELLICGRPAVRSLFDDTLDGVAGTCPSSSNYTLPTLPSLPALPSREFTFPVPNGVTSNGSDADGDGYPSYLLIETNDYSFNTSSPSSPTVRPGNPIGIPIDVFDNNDNIPAPNNICTLLPIPVATVSTTDEDGDGVPGTIIVSQGSLCVNTAAVPPSYTITNGDRVAEIGFDEDDTDPNVPLSDTSPNVITNVTYGPDRDNDKIPAYRRVWHVNYTIDRTHLTAIPTAQVGFQETMMDPDDEDRDVPIFFLSGADSDGDWVPTIVEPTLCGMQDDTFPEDGYCTAGGTNYVPPSWFQQVISSVP